MSTIISLFKFDLGSNLFVLVSEYKNYVSIGFRTCLVYTTGHQEVKLYPTKQGINLIHRQYATLVNLKDKLSKGLQKRESLTESLSYDTNVIISSVPKQQGKVVITNKQQDKVAILDRDQFKRWVGHMNEIDKAIETINNHIKSSKAVQLNMQQDSFIPPLPPPPQTDEHPQYKDNVSYFYITFFLLFILFLLSGNKVN